MAELRDEVGQLVAHLFADAGGDPAAVDNAVTPFAVLDAMESSARRWKQNPKASCDDVSRVLIDLIWNGLERTLDAR